jgi:hypothetical protein
VRTNYDILLSLAVTHPYFLSKDPDEPSGFKEVFEDYELMPDAKTGLLMKALKLIVKKINNTWHLLFQTEGPFATTVESLVNKEFFFEMKINNTAFYTATHDDYQHATGEMLWFNSPINSVMVPEKRKVYHPLKFDYTIHHAMRPVNIKVISAKGNELLNETITDVVIKKKEIDLEASGENIYDVVEDTVPPGSLESEKIFAKENDAKGDFYGVVYFKVLPVDVNADANQFQINVTGKITH